MSLREKEATSLSSAIKNLDHTHALSVDELAQYFVSRDDRIIKRMGQNLRYDYPQKYLFTGHRGTGKSTELAKFEKHFSKDFFIIRYSVDQVLDLYDITYVDVLLSIALEMLKVAHSAKIKLNDKELQYLQSFGKDIEIQREDSTATSKEAEVGGAAILAPFFNLSGKLGTESATREAVREKVQYRINDLIQAINMLAENITDKTEKKVVCIIEDLDKADIETARSIFYDYGKSITSPNIALIYTFPAALQHNDNFMQITSYFSDNVTLPNFKTYNRDGTEASGREQLRQLIHHRVSAVLIQSDALEELIKASGGIPRILLQLTKDAALEADVDDEKTIQHHHVITAMKREQQNFKRMLNEQQLQQLRSIRDNKDCGQTEAEQVLLHNLSVLEYISEQEEVWYYINPLVADLL